MALETRGTDVRVDQDGVKTIRTADVRRSVWIVAAVLVALAFAFLLYRPGRRAAQDESVDGGATTSAPNAEAPPRAPPPAFKPIRRSGPADPPAVGDAVTERAKVPAATGEAESQAADEGETEEPSGIALFPPPGTDPIKRGLIVPDDFELPPGYVRHYQATDDGQRLPAILMFHPDYDWVDEAGRPIDIPVDHIVPPELAPAGLPLQTLDVTQPQIPLIEEPADGEAAD
jgi:hypothetical protein